MENTRLSTKGQLILPKAIRDRLGWEPGTELEVEDRGDCVVVRRAAAHQATTVDDLLGCIPYTGPARTLEEMEAAVQRGAAESR